MSLRDTSSRQHRREQHAVIGKLRLLADHGDRVAAERARGQFLDEPRRGHAVADDDERLAHRSAFAQRLGVCRPIGFARS